MTGSHAFKGGSTKDVLRRKDAAYGFNIKSIDILADVGSESCVVS